MVCYGIFWERLIASYNHKPHGAMELGGYRGKDKTFCLRIRYFLEWSIEFFFFLICLPVLCGTSLFMYPSQFSKLNFMSLTYIALIDLIYVTCHLCTRLRTDGIKAMSRGFSGGKQVINFSNRRNRGRGTYGRFSPTKISWKHRKPNFLAHGAPLRARTPLISVYV